jgi:hypothetical protein
MMPIILKQYTNFSENNPLIDEGGHKSKEANLDMPMTKHALPKVWVKANLIGRLGNQLFIAASSYGISKMRNASWCLENNDLSLIESVIYWIDIPQKCENVDFVHLNENGQFATFHVNFIKSHLHQNIRVGEYLQSFKYFSHIQLPFKLKEEYLAQKWIQKYNIEIGIHVRRSDFLDFSMYSNLMPPIDYYIAAIHFINITSYYNKGKFLNKSNIFVTSDDIPWIKSQNIFYGTTISPFKDNWQTDFTVLTQCENIITSCGTFGWWAMYLNQNKGHKIYYSQPFFNFGKQDPYIIFRDFYLSSWLGITDENISVINKTIWP